MFSRPRRRVRDYVLVMDRAHWADGRALLTRVVGPALLLWAVLLGIGFAMAGPLSRPLRVEVEVNKDLAGDRSHTWNTITLVSSYLGGTEVVIGASLIIGAVVVRRTRDWRLAAVPAIAILVETASSLASPALWTESTLQSTSWTWRRGPAATQADTSARRPRYISHSPSWRCVSSAHGYGG